MEKPLPSGWTWTTIGRIRADRGKSINPATFPDEQFELYSVPRFPIGQPEQVRGADIGSNKVIVSPNTVLFCKINPRINRAWRVKEASGLRQIASTEWVVYSPVDGVEPDFLRYFLSRNEIRDFAASRASGVGGSLMRIRPSTLDEVAFPLPPLAEQRRIVAAIETQLARLDVGVAALEQAKARLKRYRAAVLKAACEGRLVPTEAELARAGGRPYEPATDLLTRIAADRASVGAHGRAPARRQQPPAPLPDDLPKLPDGWTWATWRDLANRVTVGFVGPMRHEYVPAGVPFLRSQNVRENRFDRRGLLFIPQAFHQKISKSTLNPGDLVVVRSGSVGVTCVVPDWLGEANCADLVVIQRPHILPEFGAYYMNSIARQRIQAGQVGSALIHFNTQSVAEMPVPVPPLAEQERIVAEVERHLSLIDQLEATVEANLRRSEGLRQSILRRAYSGLLISQDPTEEPASADRANGRVDWRTADSDAATSEPRQGVQLALLNE